MVYAQHWGMKIFTCLKGNFIGQDQEGNKYYQERFWTKRSRRTPRRWVIYKNLMEGSQVPAEWFGWLHHMLEASLDIQLNKSWQKPHLPNLTGTPLAYKPDGHISKEKSKKSTTKSYQPWKPS
ncbi:MAG: NADH-ubiquinone oxidoreductase subunit NDUFA12 family protein [Janthinobacterium lividum]